MSLSSSTNSLIRSYPRLKSRHFKTEISIIHTFLSEMNYVPPRINSRNIRELETFLTETMDSRNIRCRFLERAIGWGASYAEFCYTGLSLPEKRICALLAWLFLYIDDQIPNDPLAFHSFEQHFIRGIPQLDPVLDLFADTLRSAWNHWETLCANIIVCDCLNSLTSSSMEVAIQNGVALIPGITRFAWFIREGSGIAKAFASLSFGKSGGFSAMDFAQALPDMDYWIDMTNDLLSFYKEELDGETNTYVHTRAQNENKPVLQVLSEIEQETIASRNTIHAALADNPKALHTWKVFEQGYMHWHISQERYKLSELGFNSKL